MFNFICIAMVKTYFPSIPWTQFVNFFVYLVLVLSFIFGCLPFVAICMYFLSFNCLLVTKKITSVITTHSQSVTNIRNKIQPQILLRLYCICTVYCTPPLSQCNLMLNNLSTLTALNFNMYMIKVANMDLFKPLEIESANAYCITKNLYQFSLRFTLWATHL